MPKPRAGAAGSTKKHTEFEVTPWNSKRKQPAVRQLDVMAKHDAGAAPISAPVSVLDQSARQQEILEARARDVSRALAALLPDTAASSADTALQDQLAAATGVNTPSSYTAGKERIEQDAEQFGQEDGAEDEMGTGQGHAAATGQDDSDSEGNQQDEGQTRPHAASQDVIRLMSFDDDYIPPAQPAAKRVNKTVQDNTTAVVTAAAVSPARSQPVIAPPAASQPLDIHGTCRLGVLTGRAGLSGHLVTSARTQLGVMAQLVGSVSSSGHTCGISDDEELFKVTIIRWPVGGAAGGEQPAYVVSSGGDMPCWRPAEPAHLLRLPAKADETLGKLQGEQAGPTTAGSPSTQDNAHQLQVWFDATTLTGSGPQAEAMLNNFAPKLKGKGADVVAGEMRVVGLCI